MLDEQFLTAYANAISLINAGYGGYDAINGQTGDAVGRYDIIDSTYEDIRLRHPELGLAPLDQRTNADQDRAFLALAQEEAAALERAGLPVTIPNMIVVHALGVGAGPAALRSDPNTPLPPAVAAGLGRNTTGEVIAFANNLAARGAGETYSPGAATFAAAAQPTALPAAGGTPETPALTIETAPQAAQTQQNSPIVQAIADIVQNFGKPAVETTPQIANSDPSGVFQAVAGLDQSRQNLATMRDFALPQLPELPKPAPQPDSGQETPFWPFKDPPQQQKKPDPFNPLFGAARPAPLGGGIRVRA